MALRPLWHSIARTCIQLSVRSFMWLSPRTGVFACLSLLAAWVAQWNRLPGVQRRVRCRLKTTRTSISCSAPCIAAWWPAAMSGPTTTKSVPCAELRTKCVNGRQLRVTAPLRAAPYCTQAWCARVKCLFVPIGVF